MRPETIQEFTRAQPFVPFRILLTNGKLFDVRHPDLAMATRNGVLVGRAANGDVPEGATTVSYFHSVKIDPLHTPTPPAANGTAG